MQKIKILNIGIDNVSSLELLRSLETRCTCDSKYRSFGEIAEKQRTI